MGLLTATVFVALAGLNTTTFNQTLNANKTNNTNIPLQFSNLTSLNGFPLLTVGFTVNLNQSKPGLTCDGPECPDKERPFPAPGLPESFRPPFTHPGQVKPGDFGSRPTYPTSWDQQRPSRPQKPKESGYRPPYRPKQGPYYPSYGSRKHGYGQQDRPGQYGLMDMFGYNPYQYQHGGGQGIYDRYSEMNTGYGPYHQQHSTQKQEDGKSPLDQERKRLHSHRSYTRRYFGGKGQVRNQTRNGADHRDIQGVLIPSGSRGSATRSTLKSIGHLVNIYGSVISKYRSKNYASIFPVIGNFLAG